MSQRHDTATTDEELSALLDGELNAARAREIKARMAADPALARRYAALAQADSQFQAAARGLDRVPLPDSILALLDEQDQSPPDNIRTLQPRRAGSWVSGVEALPLALAASLALVVGFLAALLVGPVRQDSTMAPAGLLTAQITPATPLHTVLQTQPSGTVVQVNGMDVVAVQTFETQGGILCREVHARSSQGRTLALACREDSGWLLRTTEFLPSEESAGYQTASSTASAVAAAVARLKQGAALNMEAEAALLERWSQR
ncbi:MAG: hypothetical protein U5Q16_01840 [Gammaproteobacteria bacterium]|nr:hypothetical protein [Gammaproteobacteria bacterium]